MTESESVALPLGDAALTPYIIPEMRCFVKPFCKKKLSDFKKSFLRVGIRWKTGATGPVRAPVWARRMRGTISGLTGAGAACLGAGAHMV